MDTHIFEEALIRISRAAGKRILHIYNDPKRFEVVDFKADDSPLTQADRDANDLIVAELEALTPDIPILSEEGKDVPYAIRRTWKRFWLVDPLDGTKEFVKRNGEFTVNIALIEGNRSIMGVVHVPVTGVTFFARKGQGAFRKVGDSAPEAIKVQAVNMKASGLRIVASRSHLSDSVKSYVEKFADPEMVSMGSSLKFTVVAEGNADIYPRLAPTMEWDTGAAQIIVEEAGGEVVEYPAGTPLLYNKEILRNPHFIAFGDRT